MANPVVTNKLLKKAVIGLEIDNIVGWWRCGGCFTLTTSTANESSMKIWRGVWVREDPARFGMDSQGPRVSNAPLLSTTAAVKDRQPTGG